VGQGWSADPRRDTEAANRYSDAALERDETNSWVLSVSGLVAGYLNCDLDKAMGLYDRALTINPSAQSAWLWSTSALAWLGRGDEAILRAPRAIELSPLDPFMFMFNATSAVAHTVAGNYDQAIEFSRRSIRQNAVFASSQRILAIALVLAGRVDEARSAVNGLMQLEPGLTVGGFAQRYPGRQAEHASRFFSALAEAGVPP
jgi:tetratricopeptide (TPR) repeat protein